MLPNDIVQVSVYHLSSNNSIQVNMAPDGLRDRKVVATCYNKGQLNRLYTTVQHL